MGQDDQGHPGGDNEVPAETTDTQISSPNSINETHEYPPLPTVLLVICGLYIAMFLVSLVSLLTCH